MLSTIPFSTLFPIGCPVVHKSWKNTPKIKYVKHDSTDHTKSPNRKEFQKVLREPRNYKKNIQNNPTTTNRLISTFI